MNNYKRAVHRVADNEAFNQERRAFRGILVCVTIGLAATLLSSH